MPITINSQKDLKFAGKWLSATFQNQPLLTRKRKIANLEQHIQGLKGGKELKKVLAQRDNLAQENNSLIISRNTLAKEVQRWESSFNTLLNKYGIKTGKSKDLTDMVDNLLTENKEQKETIKELTKKLEEAEIKLKRFRDQYHLIDLNKIATEEREIEILVSQARNLFNQLLIYRQDNTFGKNNKNIQEVINKMKNNPLLREQIE
jgi:chromosome segregation ATPase